MSWQAYVDTNLVGTSHVSQAAIYGLNGGAWATSTGFQLQPAEVNEVIATFSNPTDALANGIHIAGDADGICIVKTGQAFLVGIYKGGIQPSNYTKVVEGLADYLISIGY